MEGKVEARLEAERPWQADLCQFFTRDKVVELCLRHVAFPENLLTMRLLQAGGPAKVRSFCRCCLVSLKRVGRKRRRWISCGRLFAPMRLTGRSRRTFAGNARRHLKNLMSRAQRQWKSLNVGSGTKTSWRRAQESALRTLSPILHISGGIRSPRLCAMFTRRGSNPSNSERICMLRLSNMRLGCLGPTAFAFLCPGTWTRNIYGNAIREAFTSKGQLKTIIDFSDVDSFETSADAYPHFFVFQKDSAGPTSNIVRDRVRQDRKVRQHGC